jgi:DNA-binding response OmpR family regulator
MASIAPVVPERTILCVGEEAETREVFRDTLTDYRLVFAANAYEALRALNNEVFDAYLLDFWLPDWSGVQLCREIRKRDPHGPVLFCSAAVRDGDRQRAARAGASAYLYKPVDPALLRSRVEALAQLAQSESLAARSNAQDALDTVLDEFTRKLTALGRPRQVSSTLVEQAARQRVYKAFVSRRGTRAHFERWWSHAFDRALENMRETADVTLSPAAARQSNTPATSNSV